MPLFYHVDRKSDLIEGQVLSLIHPVIESPPEFANLSNFGRNMIPNGVSRHGDQYFYGGNSRTNDENSIIEILIEYYRRAYFPDRPSRFQCWFGVESLDEALLFQTNLCQGHGAIWEVETDNYFKADMNILSHQTVLIFSYLANAYWLGQPAPHKSPFWEILLTPPVKVLRKVEYGKETAKLISLM